MGLGDPILSENGEWVEEITRLETGQRAKGGIDGILNIQARQLANRTRWLKHAISGSFGKFYAWRVETVADLFTVPDITEEDVGKVAYIDELRIGLVLSSYPITEASWWPVGLLLDSATTGIDGGNNPYIQFNWSNGTYYRAYLTGAVDPAGSAAASLALAAAYAENLMAAHLDEDMGGSVELSSSQDVQLPPLFDYVEVDLVGPGGGGGGGCAAAGAAVSGGGSGAGGGHLRRVYTRAEIAAEYPDLKVPVIIGAGGIGAAGATGTTGIAGSASGSTQFGSLLTAHGGGSGSGGSVTTASAGGGAGSERSHGGNAVGSTAGTGSYSSGVSGGNAANASGFTSGTGGAGCSAAGVAGQGAASADGGCSGGAGGGVSAAGIANAGGSARNKLVSRDAAGGAVPGGHGVSAANVQPGMGVSGAAGSGGAGSTTTNGGNGGNGGTGSGGGGGGSTVSGFTGGAGGTGGDGKAWIRWWRVQ